MVYAQQRGGNKRFFVCCKSLKEDYHINQSSNSRHGAQKSLLSQINQLNDRPDADRPCSPLPPSLSQRPRGNNALSLSVSQPLSLSLIPLRLGFRNWSPLLFLSFLCLFSLCLFPLFLYIASASGEHFESRSQRVDTLAVLLATDSATHAPQAYHFHDGTKSHKQRCSELKIIIWKR